MRRLLLAGTAGLLLAAAEPATGGRTVLDDFDGIAGWTAAPSEGVLLTLAADAGEAGRGALRMDYDFRGHGGWAAARKAFPRALPENWAIRLRLRGNGPPQTLEFKLLDASGQSVWWSVRRDFAFPRDWTTLTIRKRQVTFAWGPAGGGELRDLGSIEITVTASAGGSGSVWVDGLTLETLPPPGAPAPPLPAWRSDPGAGEAQDVRLDLGGRREIGGLSLFWDAADFARLYDVEISDDGAVWTRVRSVSSAHGGRAWISLPETDAAYVRLRLQRSSRGRGYALTQLKAEPPEISETPTKFLETVARDAPRGEWPRSLRGEQIYWTLVGVDGGREKGLLSEDGALETGRGGYSVEPFLRKDGRLLGWAEAEISQSLAEGDLPIPSVRRLHSGGLALTVTALAEGPAAASTMHARYRVENPGSSPAFVTLYLALRPVQVNPPWQFLSTQGGAAPIRRIHWDGTRVSVEGAHSLLPVTPPAAFGASSFDDGEIVARLSAGDLPRQAEATDRDGFASAALAWNLALPARGSADVVVAVPFFDAASDVTAVPGSFDSRLAAVSRSWREKVSRVAFTVPAEAEPVARAARSNLAWILINRDGPEIRPGSRSYARSWIRDGSLTSAALMRLGHAEEAGAFLRWFAPHQFESGMVPCCVDSRGADPVPENDSHGELIYLAAEHLRYTGDRATAEAVWPHVARAATYVDSLRAQRRTAEYRAGTKVIFFGLLPESISHEGYSSKPVHSYWDDFFALRGLEDAAWMAGVLGKTADAERFSASFRQMQDDVQASIRAVIAAKGLDFIPGSADLGDFDATSTTIALEPGGQAGRLPQAELARTFEIYWQRFLARAANRRAAGNEYTPYEWRVAGSFVRLGRRDRAEALFDFFMADRRPAAWNHWAEVVWNEPRMPKFIGDMPHGWVGSDFLRSFLDLFAYDEAGTLVLGAGLPADWIEAPGGAAVRGLRTPYGSLDLAMRAEGGDVRVRIAGGAAPPGGFVVPWPLGGAPASASIDGRAVPVPESGRLAVPAGSTEVLLKGAHP